MLTVVSGCNSVDSDKIAVDSSIPNNLLNNEILSKQELAHFHEILKYYFDKKLPDRSFNGAILVAKKGNIIYERYSGKTDLRLNDPVSDSTAFHIASTSKTFTSVAILQLVQKKIISLDDSLSKFFPEFPYSGITIRMLLNHHSGLPNYLYFISNSNWDKTINVTNADVVNQLYELTPPPDCPAGKKFIYSNTNFVLLAVIVEKVTGMSFPDYIRTNFFIPLKMKDSYVFTIADTERATPSFNYNNSYWRNDFLEMTYGDKNIYASARDLLKWDQALYTEKLISKELLAEAFSPSVFKKNEREPAIHNYGLGFRLMINPAGKKVVYHFGRWHGFNAAFSRLTEEEVTIIILGNKFTRSIYNAASSLYNIFGKYYPEENKIAEPDDELSKVKKDLPQKSTKGSALKAEVTKK